MTILEKKSARKKKAIKEMIKNGDWSLGYALNEVERLNDENKLMPNDYEELAEYIEELLNQEEVIEQVEDQPESAEETEVE